MSKILFIINKLDYNGGEQRVLSLIANNLSKENDVIVYSMKNKKNNVYPLEGIPIYYGKKKYGEFTRVGLRLFEIIINKVGIEQNWYTPDDIWEVNKLKKLIKLSNFDSIIFSGGHTYKYLERLKREHPNIKMFAWLHYSAEQELTRKFNQNLKMMKLADGVISLTNLDADWVRQFTNRSYCIYNPLTATNNHISCLNQQIISFVGRLDEKQKGLDYLVELAKALPKEWKINVAGSGTMIQKIRFDYLISKAGVSGKINKLGFLEGERLSNHYLNSSIFVMTSRFEGFGLVLPEAMSYGLPIVAFEQTGSKEVLDNGKYGILVKNGDVQSIGSIIEKLIKDERLRKHWQEKSLVRVKDFELTHIMDKWTKLVSIS